MIGPLEDAIAAAIGVSVVRVRWAIITLAFVLILVALGLRLFVR